MIFIVFIFSTGFTHEFYECQIDNCEKCSIFNENMCINCENGYTRNKDHGCIKADINKNIEIHEKN